MHSGDYYKDPWYHEYLLSSERRNIFPYDKIFHGVDWGNITNLLDFGAGNGYYYPTFYKYLPNECKIWAGECQEELIDQILSRKVKGKWKRLTPFYIEHSEFPLIPDWLPPMDIAFCSCVLSTFANPSLAIEGISRCLVDHGRILIVDWHKKNTSNGPSIEEKIPPEKMISFLEKVCYSIIQRRDINDYVYLIEAERRVEVKSGQ